MIFVAGDDMEAKATVSKLIEEIRFAALDAGSLREGGRRQQPSSPIYTRQLNTAQAKELLARKDNQRPFLLQTGRSKLCVSVFLTGHLVVYWPES